MFELLSSLFSYIFIAIIYLFIFSIIRLIYMDIRLTSLRNRDGDSVDDEISDEDDEGETVDRSDYGEYFGILKVIAARENIPNLSDEYILDKEVVTIGRIARNSVCDIEIDDAFLSGEHLRLTFDGSDWFAEDLASRNGTFVNGETIDSCKLANGDEITIGGVIFAVEY